MNEPPNSRYLAANLSGQPIVWITRSSGFSTSQTSFTPSSHCCGSSEPRSKWRMAAPVRWPWVPSASTVALAIRSEPGSKFESSSPSRPRPLSPLRTPTTLAVLHEQLGRGGLAEDVHARVLGLLGEPAAELRDRGHVVAVVAERRRRGLERNRALAVRQQVDRVLRRRCRTSATRPRAGPGTASSSPTGSSSPPTAGASPGPCPSPPARSAPRRATRSAPRPRRAAARAGSAQASPAGPPPTIATPTSIRSSSGSVGRADELLLGVDRRRELDRGGGHASSPSSPSLPR